MPTGRTAGSLQDFTYSFDVQKGNLLSRTDNSRNKTETFGYDNLNRLSTIGSQQISYAANGNITAMPGVGTLAYENSAKPYQVTMLTPTGAAVPIREQNVTYTSYQRPNTISEDGITASFAYNSAGDRVKMEVKQGATDLLTRYYLGKQYELDVQTNAQRLYVGGDAYSAPAIYVKEGTGSWETYYILRDYLGSITHIANSDGSLKQELSYDAWGRLRDPSTQVAYVPGNEPALFSGRGYTGHEYLPWFGLVNMNARLYDPALGRFLSPDPYVQMPDFTQNFNRYSYALNNPLVYVDENGEFIHLVLGAIIGGTVNLVSNWKNIDGNFWKGLGYFGVGAVAGTLSAGIGAGVNAAMAGGSFGAGFMGTAVGVSSTGFVAGAATGTAAGFAGGLATNSGNAWMDGANLGEGLWNGIKGGGIGALAGGVLGGTIGGIDALTKRTNFWTGKASFDLSNSYSASGTAIGDKTVTGKFVGKFEGVNLYEAQIPEGAAATLPGRGIILSKGQYTLNSTSIYTQELLQHEFGHILQAKEVGLMAFYRVIAPESLASATMNGVGKWSHSTFWTETWANYLSNNYFGINSLLNNSTWPVENISWYNLLRLRVASPFFWP